MEAELQRYAVLALDVGHGVVLNDVQLWRNKVDAGTGHVKTPRHTCLLIGTIDIDKLPLWIKRIDEGICYTTDPITFGFFKSKLMRRRHRSRGLVVEVCFTESNKEYMVFYRELEENRHFIINQFMLDISLKRQLDTMLPTDAVITQERRTGGRSPSTHIDKVVQKTHTKCTECSLKMDQHFCRKNPKNQFVSILSQCILSGLRLRNISQTQCEKIYKMTYKASEFAFRNEIGAKDDISFEKIHVCVETLLKLFTRS